MSSRLKASLLPAWSLLLALMVLLPVLMPGYVLHVDMVFVPQQTLLPWNLGIGGGLPRSVPQDAVVSLIAGPIPGQVIQKVVLLASLVLAGVGAGRLAGPSLALRLPAASIYLWSAYTAARLLMGHWGLLWAAALLPWVIIAARTARRRGDWLPVVLLCGIGALVPTGGILLALVAVPLAIGFGSALPPSRRGLIVAGVIAVNAPWWLAAVRSSSLHESDPLGLVVFGARADGVGGVLTSVLAGGGVWNSEATLGSRTTVFAAMGVVVLVALAALGWQRWWRENPPEAVVLGALAVLGVLWAWISGTLGSQVWAQQIVSAVPGGGLLRDGQKWTVWWVLLLAVCAPWGLQRLLTRADENLRLFLAGSLTVLPIALLPDLAAGAFGRLQAHTYPQEWDGLRDQLARSQVAGDVVSLPWSPFRRYSWNGSGVVLDPLPRYLTRTVVWNDDLPVVLFNRLVEVGGDDPRAKIIGDTIASSKALPPRLAELGVAWIVVQRDQPQASRQVDLRGATMVWEQGDLQLWRVDTAVTVRAPEDRVLVAVNVGVLLLLLGGSMVWITAHTRSRL